MAEPIAPPPAPTVPQYPALGSPTFNQQAYAYGTSMPGVTLRQWELAQNGYTNAQITYTFALSAQASAAAALNAVQVVNAASNFKGRWVDLTGPLAPPASVLHLGQYWALTAAVTNVAAEVPGTSTKWAALPSSARIMQTVTSGVVDALPWVTYKIAGADVTIRFPATANDGDLVGVRLIVPVSGLQILDFRGKPFRGLIHSLTDFIDTERFGFDFYYDTTLQGWV